MPEDSSSAGEVKEGRQECSRGHRRGLLLELQQGVEGVKAKCGTDHLESRIQHRLSPHSHKDQGPGRYLERCRIQVSKYLVEAKIAHIEEGWSWSHLLDRHFKLCMKAACRGKGPPKKAPEVAEAEWAKFPLLADPDQPTTTVRMAVHLFACGVHWMMREIELANLCTNDVKFDHKNRLVTLTDGPAGHVDFSHVAVPVRRSMRLEMPLRCTGSTHESSVSTGNPEGALSVDVKGTRATKAQLVADWRAVLGDITTGHSTRRSGALQYIRKGWSSSQVAFLRRWKSNIILEYAKEALQTIAFNSESNRFGTLSNMINQGKESLESQANAIPRVTDDFVRKEVIEKLESEIKSFVKGTKVASSRLEASVKDLEAKYNDYTKYLPKWVKSTRNQITHRNGRVVLCSPAPLRKTLCGWKYYSSDYEFHDGEREVCKKCKASALEQEGAGG